MPPRISYPGVPVSRDEVGGLSLACDSTSGPYIRTMSGEEEQWVLYS